MTEIAADLFQAVDGLHDLPVKHVPSFRRHHLSGRPAEKRLADLRFQGGQVLAQRRLGHEPGLRRSRDGTVAVYRDKRSVPFKISHNFFYTPSPFVLFEL